MAQGTRRKHSAAFKAKVALVAMVGDRIMAEQAQQYEGHLEKLLFSSNLCVIRKILSSEYRIYACGKIFRMP